MDKKEKLDFRKQLNDLKLYEIERAIEKKVIADIRKRQKRFRACGRTA